MASLIRFALTDVIIIGPGDQPIIQVITDASCTLTMHYTLSRPTYERITRIRRGHRALLDLRWYLTNLVALTQEQPADTRSHSFTIPPIPEGATLYFHFTATLLGIPAISGTAIYQYSDGGYPMQWSNRSINYLFESLDGYDVTWCTGAATVVVHPSGPRFDTGPNPGDKAMLRDYRRNWGIKPSGSHGFFRVIIYRWPLFADSETWLLWGNRAGGNQRFGFHIVGTRVYLHSGDGTGNSDLDTGIDIENMFAHYLEARLFHNQSIEFYYAQEWDIAPYHVAAKTDHVNLHDTWSPEYELIAPSNANDKMTLKVAQTLTPTWRMM